MCCTTRAEIADSKSKAGASKAKTGLTSAQEQEIKTAIANAKTLQEVNALEAQLKSGQWGQGAKAMEVGN